MQGFLTAAPQHPSRRSFRYITTGPSRYGIDKPDMRLPALTDLTGELTKLR